MHLLPYCSLSAVLTNHRLQIHSDLATRNVSPFPFGCLILWQRWRTEGTQLYYQAASWRMYHSGDAQTLGSMLGTLVDYLTHLCLSCLIYKMGINNTSWMELEN